MPRKKDKRKNPSSSMTNAEFELVPDGGVFHTPYPINSSPQEYGVERLSDRHTIAHCWSEEEARQVVGSINLAVILQDIGLDELHEDMPLKPWKKLQDAKFWLAYSTIKSPRTGR